MLIFGRSWMMSGTSGDGTSIPHVLTFTVGFPPDTLTGHPRSSLHSVGVVTYVLRLVCPLTLTSRSNATVLGFIPGVIFSIESTANKVFIIRGVIDGIMLVLDVTHQMLVPPKRSNCRQISGLFPLSYVFILLNTSPSTQDILNRAHILFPSECGRRRS